jgi:hypothetical protein
MLIFRAIARKAATKACPDWSHAALVFQQKFKSLETKQVMQRKRASCEGLNPTQQAKVDLLLDALMEMNYTELAVFRY